MAVTEEEDADDRNTKKLYRNTRSLFKAFQSCLAQDPSVSACVKWCPLSSNGAEYIKTSQQPMLLSSGLFISVVTEGGCDYEYSILFATRITSYLCNVCKWLGHKCYRMPTSFSGGTITYEVRPDPL